MDGFSEVPETEGGIYTAGGHQTLGGMTSHMSQLAVVAGKRLQQSTGLHVVQVGNPENLIT